MTLQQIITQREEKEIRALFKAWLFSNDIEIEDLSIKNEEKIASYWIRKNHDTITMVLDAVREIVESKKKREGRDVGSFKWQQIECDYNEALDDIFSALSPNQK